MWGRVLECVLGLWLIISPFIFDHFPTPRSLWLNDMLSGAAVVAIALGSIWPPLRYLHLLNLLVGAWLIGYGYLAGGYPNLPGHQNEIFIGLTLMLFAIIPNDANQPPPSWRQ